MTVMIAVVGVLVFVGVCLAVYAVTENSYRASLPEEIVSIQLDESTAFLIPARDGYLLFDTGYPWDYDTFLAAIAAHDISLSSIRYTFISHGGKAEMPVEVGMDATLLLTPGHTSDSSSLLYEGTYLFCGDLTSTTFNLVGGSQLTVFNENVEAVYESWSKVLSRDIPITVPSHGHPFRTEKLERYIGRLTQDQLVTFF